MIRRPPTRLPAGLLVAAGVVAAVGVVTVAAGAAVVAVVALVVAVAAFGAAAVVIVGGGGAVVIILVTASVVADIVADALSDCVQGRYRGVRDRRTRSSGSPSGLGWRRVPLGGNMRRLLHACASVDRLVNYLLDRTVEKLPVATSARFAEEWQDHRQHYSGWRLVWWALCVRATARHTVAAFGPARLPRDS